jgi:hypothetical protein
MHAYRQNGPAQGSRTVSSSAAPGKRSLVEAAQRGILTAPAVQATPAAAKPDQKAPTLGSRKPSSPGSDSRPPTTHAGEQAAIPSLLHSSIGNTHVHSATDVLGFDDPFDVNKPRFPPPTVPMAKEAALKALMDKGDAERLLTGRGMDASEQAAAALDILVNVPDSHRGKVIDELDAKASTPEQVALLEAEVSK